MNEDFMKQFQKMPNSQLVEKIHALLKRKERVQKYKKYSIRSAAVLLAVFGMLMTFSSTVRADVSRTIAQSQVGQFVICYVGFSPIGAYIESDLPICNTGDGILTSNPNKALSLEEAQTIFASPIVLPEYLPSEFDRRNDIEFFDLTNQPTLVFTWDHKNSYKMIKLLISHNDMELEKYARTLGKGAIEEITLKGKPAIIIRGVWNIGVQENDFMMTALMWRYDENTVYSLMSLEHAVPLDELIKMAESIP